MTENQDNTNVDNSQESKGLRLVMGSANHGEVIHEFGVGQWGPLLITGKPGFGYVKGSIHDPERWKSVRKEFADHGLSEELADQILNRGKIVMIYGDFNSGKTTVAQFLANQVGKLELSYGRPTAGFAESMSVDDIQLGVESAIDNGVQTIYVDGANDARIIEPLLDAVIHDREMHAVVTFQPTATALRDGTGLKDQLFERFFAKSEKFFDKGEFENYLRWVLVAIRVTKDSVGHFKTEVFTGDDLDKA